MGKEKKVKNPPTKKKSIIIISITAVLCCTLGAVAGLVVNKFFLGPAVYVDSSKMDESKYKPDIDAIMQKYNNAKALGVDYSIALTPDEMVNAGYQLYSQYPTTASYSYGEVNAAIVLQDVRAASFKVNNEYFEESLSKSSFVSVAARMYQHPEDKIDFYRGEAKTVEVGEFDAANKKEYNYADYKAEFGKIPSTPCIYIISSKTVNADKCNVESTTDGYKVHLDFKATLAVINYVKQMKSISQLGEYPSFYSLEIDFELDKNCLVKHMKSIESYYARTAQGVGSDSNGVMNIYYYTDKEVTIPELNVPVNYEEGKPIK